MLPNKSILKIIYCQLKVKKAAREMGQKAFIEK